MRSTTHQPGCSDYPVAQCDQESPLREVPVGQGAVLLHSTFGLSFRRYTRPLRPTPQTQARIRARGLLSGENVIACHWSGKEPECLEGLLPECSLPALGARVRARCLPPRPPQGFCYGLICSPAPDRLTDAPLTPGPQNVTICGNRVLKEVIRSK